MHLYTYTFEQLLHTVSEGASLTLTLISNQQLVHMYTQSRSHNPYTSRYKQYIVYAMAMDWYKGIDVGDIREGLVAEQEGVQVVLHEHDWRNLVLPYLSLQLVPASLQLLEECRDNE